MKVLLDNVNTSSSSGPNSFGKKLKIELEKLGHVAETQIENPDVQLSFIMLTKKIAPAALRLDGIYFNTRQDWDQQNRPLKISFDASELVIYQSEFNRRLTEKFFGIHRNSIVINNGTCFETISAINRLENPILDKFSEVWSCASSWRPHKRLKDNINYFLSEAPKDACLVVAGENPDYKINDPRILYAGQLSWEQCISLYKRSKTFIHLAFIDHCPNVVVDARASGCNIIVASSGGTKEIAGKNSIVVRDKEWDMTPLDLYSPPDLNFKDTIVNEYDKNIDIKTVSKLYCSALQDLHK
jgi:glycosyltransferase involved in cell wall biosynthesis